MKKIFLCLFMAISLSVNLSAQPIQPGAEQFDQYLPLLAGKRVGLFANQTTVLSDKTHLVDALLKKGITITRIFSPEHGFRGTADAGEKVESSVDPATGINVVSLYGKNRKPSAADLAEIDIMIFDIQDIGVRFYTFISSLEEFMETAVEAGKPLLVLDRPNPNGFYIDGPVLEKPYRSFVGMQTVPVVYGMTIGEYAKMILGEKWLDSSLHAKLPAFQLTVIPCANYTHSSKYVLPVKPSPNLPDMSAIYWYASTCYFEGTVLSEGRGTDKPFQIFGHPELPKHLYSFTPTPRDGARDPKLKNQLCYGWNISGTSEQTLKALDNKIQLKYLLEAYRLFPDKSKFFLGKPDAQPTQYFFNKLAGNADLMRQIKAGATESEIRLSWQPALNRFKQIRKKYLLYEDFH
ncbi:exo-beta-N-acetylmuramidase NamZ domain-containing protein [Flavihumibacter stibioxidans]|uniref:DUF1343 domain-containing protein n=1 Tax=Flavihumibacter stibioxidans TaxID=1834163 RepID=A0ABR7MC37_9BACT|nr:DUF1343 domain-containing protein [Flavihumibacter stibioxidans]MBC6492603.1 hypothetical protein [Flavihumibacter stibioxidans]